MKQVFGYIRVSTAKQGTGVSLQEQKEAIVKYAEKHDLQIIHWFEEQETAAKQGRPKFNEMIKRLRFSKVKGVIIHKIDRSARNLKDWAILGDLIDQGIEVHFAHESLDLDTRGGRLAADIQAVIASDYIRNLREEALKGLYGRLKQGVYPFKAPLGYLDTGRGNIKKIDPMQGPFIKKVFQLYSTEKYSLDSLAIILWEMGLRNSKNEKVSVTTLSKILHNSFYTGIIRVKGKTFQGKHQQLVSSDMFLKVQDILNGKTNTKVKKHNFLYRRLIKCSKCERSLIAEKQKGIIYYRCHSKSCMPLTLKEEFIEMEVIKQLGKNIISNLDSDTILEQLEIIQLAWNSDSSKLQKANELQGRVINDKLNRLTDAYVENLVDKVGYEERKEKLMISLQNIVKNESYILKQKEFVFTRTKKLIELLKDLKNTYQIAIVEEKRKLIKNIISNFTYFPDKLVITIRSPYLELMNWYNSIKCEDDRDTPRTFANLAINPVTKVAEFVGEPQPINDLIKREHIKQLLEIILAYFEEEQLKVENGLLDPNETLLPDVQENDPSTQYTPRPIPENFKRKRA